MSDNIPQDSAAEPTVNTTVQTAASNEQYTWDAVPEPRRRRPKLRRRHRNLKTIILLVIALIVVLAGMTLDYKPAVSGATAVKSVSLGEIRESVMKNLDRNRDQKFLVMDLSENEVNTAIAYVLQNTQCEQQKITAQWSNGCVNGTVSIPLYGLYLNVYFSAVPLLKDGKITFDLRCCKIGRLPLPAKVRTLAVGKLEQYMHDNAVFVGVQKAVKQINVTENNNLQIIWDIDQKPNPVYPAERSEQDDEKFTLAAENLLGPINQAAEKQAASCKVLVKAEDINVLLAGVITNNWESVRQEHEPHLYAVWQKGGLQIYSKYVNKNGVYYNLTLGVTPQAENGKLSIKVKSCSVGKIELPAAAVEKILQKQIDPAVNNSGEFNDVLQALHSIKTAGDDAVEFDVDPVAASEMLQSMF